MSLQTSRQTIEIAGRKIGLDASPFIIAEMSGNHNQSLERALSIVEAAAKAGAHALKLQTYTADTMTLDLKHGEFFIHDKNSLWEGNSLYELYQQAYTPWEWHEPIMKRCAELGVICFSSPFDATAVDFLEGLNASAYKIASFENIDLPLIERVARTGKPVIISTGMASVEEIEEAVNTARRAGCEQLILLKCTSSYPAPPENIHLKTIPDLRNRFNAEIGLSDHTMGIGVSVAAIALGATVIEKHFTLSRAEGGVDSAFSLEPDELAMLVSETEKAWQALGRVNYELTEAEVNSRVFRRSLYVSEEMKAGDILSEKNCRAIRPGLGLPPKHYQDVLGRRVKADVSRGTPLSWDLLE